MIVVSAREPSTIDRPSTKDRAELLSIGSPRLNPHLAHGFGAWLLNQEQVLAWGILTVCGEVAEWPKAAVC
jgi:hypothetical protein